MSDFVHLHLHTEYSLLDGLNRTGPLVKKVKDSGMKAVAVTDHGTMYGVTEFWNAATAEGIKPIIGCEMYISPGDQTIRKEIDGIRYYHIVLLAKNKQGYININKLSSIGHMDGFYYKPRVDRETLEKYSEGIICSTACLAGPISRHILRDEEKNAIDWLKFLKTTFKDDFYLEVMRNGYEGQDEWSDRFATGLTQEEIKELKKQMKVNKKLFEYSKEFDVPVIASTDAHYLNKEDKEAQTVLFAIKDGKLLTEAKREGYVDTYVKTPEEMEKVFSDHPEVLENTVKIADKIEEYKLSFDRIQPRYLMPDTGKPIKDAQGKLREIVYEGAKVKYGEMTDELKERIEYELEVIHNKGYDDYFLMVSDIIRWARKNKIVVGVRGSASGSVVSYCIDIINVEPIDWELYFDRFLNPERPSPPDIDIDFQDDRRDEVVQYVKDKYGQDSVTSICAIGRMKTKAAIRDVARVMGIDLSIADQLSKMVHVKFGKVKKINDMMEDDQEFAEIVNSSAELQKLKDIVSQVEGMARHISTHACGFLITPNPTTDYVAIQKESNGGDNIITQQEGVWLEELGFMKFDFLGLRNLTIIKNTLDLIKKYHDVDLSPEDIPLDDEKTFELFGKGETTGVFQFESPPMQKYLIELQPQTLEDLCFMTSAYRPGPLKYIPEYIKCKHGEQEPDYLVPEMKPILEKTFGFAIYQEQVMKIAVELADYSMGEADLLRRAMGKKKHKIMKKEEPKFKKGITDKGYSKEIADQIWEYLLPFADYGFNKAHGASYALVSYWCGYLKAHYPIEFMTGLMHSDIDDSDRIAIDMSEARHMGFTILPPDINKSDVYFSIEKGKFIRFGLAAIKNVGMGLVESIVAERKENGRYESFDDFVRRIIDKKINKKALECLIKVGAFDKFGFRNQFLAIYPQVYENASKRAKVAKTGQVGLFGAVASDKDSILNENFDLPDIPDLEDKQKISWEKDLIGSYITAHPLDKYSDVLLQDNTFSVAELASLTPSQLKSSLASANTKIRLQKKFNFLCVISAVKTILTKKGNKPMAILNLEDQQAQADAVIFPKTYEALKSKLQEGEVFLVYAQVSERDDKLNLIVEELFDTSQFNNSKDKQLAINISNLKDSKKIQKIKQAIHINKGGDYVLKITYGNPTAPKTIKTTVKANPELINTLNEYIVK